MRTAPTIHSGSSGSAIRRCRLLSSRRRKLPERRGGIAQTLPPREVSSSSRDRRVGRGEPGEALLVLIGLLTVGLSDLNLRVLIPYFPVLGWGALRTLKISALAISPELSARPRRRLDAAFRQPLRAQHRHRLCRNGSQYSAARRPLYPFPRSASVWHSDQRPDRRSTGPGDQQHRLYDRDLPRRLCRDPARPI